MIRNRAQLLRDPLPAPVRRRRAVALDLLEAALESVEPGEATRAALLRADPTGRELRGSVVFAFGKAARAMAEAAVAVVGPRGGVVIGPDASDLPPLRGIAAGHPVPDIGAEGTGEEVLALARSLKAGDCALCLVSGGGSSMLELPRRGVSVQDIREITRALLAGGAGITEVNSVRRDLSRLKGGRLAAALHPARTVNIVLSDVPGHPPEIVASGPTMKPPYRPHAFEVLRRYELLDGLAGPVRAALLDAQSHPVPPRLLARVESHVAADNARARAAIVEEAAWRGLTVHRDDVSLVGEARIAGPRFYRRARARLDGGDDVVVQGGETTVVVRGDGVGGRNHELALAVAAGESVDGLLVAFGTDGFDGSAGAAGALVDEAVLADARERGMDPRDFLARNDSGTFFAELGASIVTGPTGTNVADLTLLLR